MSTSYTQMLQQFPKEKQPESKWAQEDLKQKQEILQCLFTHLNNIEAKHKEGLIGFLLDCSNNAIAKDNLQQLFELASKNSCDFEEFESFFTWLNPLDAKMIPFNDKSLGIKPWPDSATSATLAVENQNLFEQYLRDSGLPASISARDIENHSLHIDSEDIYPIHSVAKIFTGITVLSLIEEKPDGVTSIIAEEMLHKPIKELLDEEVWQLLTPLQHHLETNNVSLLQLMTHYGGLGDYGYDRGTGTYRERLEEGTAPQIMEVKDFLQFAEQTTYPAGKWHYSNLGITLVGLAIENAYSNYQKTHPSLTLAPLNFFGILKKYVLDNAQINNFFVKAPVDSTYQVRVNQEDKAALAWAGGPAGGYWTSTSELVKFGQWLYEKCKDPLFKELITKYGEEFIKDGKIMHPGLSTFSSAFFFFDLATGKTGAVAATHKSALSIGLELALGDRMFIDNKEAKNTITVTAEQQEQNPDSSLNPF